MGTMREEIYDRLHPLLEQLLDIACDQIESIEEDDSSISENFDIDKVLEQLEDYGKYKGVLQCEGESFENYIPVSVAKQIVRGRGLGGVLGYLEEK